MILYAFIFNILFFSFSSVILYSINPQEFHKNNDGLFSSLGIMTLLFFVPIITWLNIIFMLGAIIGMLTYTFAGQLIGTIIIICAMLFKVVECCLRFMR